MIRTSLATFVLLCSVYACIVCADRGEAQLNPAAEDAAVRPGSGTANGTVVPPALGELEPVTGLLPAGTVSVTLSITTSMPAGCRWGESPATPYDALPNDFDWGQGDVLHTALVSGFQDLAERTLYVRCRATPENPELESSERMAHLRVLGPWDGGYPRIVNLWGPYDPALGPQFYARYDLYIPSWWANGNEQARRMRVASPRTKILIGQNATYGWPEVDSLSQGWRDSQPNEPGYNCLLRDTERNILYGGATGPVYFNLIDPYCRDVLVAANIASFLSPRSYEGADLAYDGIYWDGLAGSTTWIVGEIDSNLDGVTDEKAALDQAYSAGVQDFISRVRARLPYAILTGNESPLEYSAWLNGRLYEWQLPAIKRGNEAPAWGSVINNYQVWSGSGPAPRLTFVFAAPEQIYESKYADENHKLIPPAMQVEAAASYDHMRFGLTSALMADGMFFHDLRHEEGILWWYDEYGAPANLPGSALPERGYLGQPTDGPYLLDETLDTPDQITNGGFEDGLADWRFWVDSGTDAAATFTRGQGAGVAGTAAAHVIVTNPAYAWDVQIKQGGISMIEGASYTASFWARATVTQTIRIRVTGGRPPGSDYGFDQYAALTPQWQHFHLWDFAILTGDEGELEFQLGAQAGEFWLDDIAFQAGAIGVWGRPFEQGLAVVNATEERQTVSLPATYCKINGSQAPLFQVRVDDSEAEFSAGWSQLAAGPNQFGWTVSTTEAGSGASAVYTPDILYAGRYEVLAWVAPASGQSSAVVVNIHSAHGDNSVTLDQTAGEPGWRTLGMHDFEAGAEGSATLTATGSGLVIADEFKWVSVARYNDGQPVTQLTLEPLDGIILLNGCRMGSWLAYLPLIASH